MEQVMNLTFASSLTDLCEINQSFDRGVLKIAYVGDNRNHSSISKRAFQNCLHTMYNCPIVCNYDRETDSLGGHDMQVVRGADGGLRIVNATTPVGVIPESAKTWFKKCEEEDGTVHEYLFAEALLWKRQEAYRKIKKDGITGQSMEITVRDSAKKDGGIMDIRDFVFTAFCLLGDDVEPCYEGASLDMSLAADFKQQLSEMMQELKESFSLVTPSEEDNNTHPTTDFSTEGGEKVLHEQNELNPELEVQFQEEQAETEAVTENTETFAEQEPAAEAAVSENGEGAENFELTGNLMSELLSSLESVTMECEWGVFPRYCYADSDLENNMVYAWDCQDWLLYGFSFAKDGDHVNVDFESRKRMKYTIVEFDEGEQASPFMSAFQRMTEKLNDAGQWESKYQSASDTIASMETELGELRQFKADTENEALQSAREAVFARFEDLIGVEAFETLREHAADFSTEELEEKCYALRGRAGTTAKFSREEKAPKLKVVHEDSLKKEPYGGLFARFGIEAE
jgi:hypothetical protein